MVEQQAIRKLQRRLLPFLMLAFFVAILDRVNISIAALTMNKDLGFSNEVFGLGAGIFFLGYVLFEIPSNMIMEKVGARRWIARIMITWGVISVLMMFVNSVPTFYALRILLGIAEAGFYPGIIYYLTRFFPYEYRTKAFGTFQMASPIAVAIGSPISGLILNLDGIWGLKGWQWVFLIEGLPAVILGIICLYYLTDSPRTTKWLTDEEKDWIEGELKKENSQKEFGHLKYGQLFSKPQFWLQILVYSCIVISLYGVSFWLPMILKQTSGLSNVTVSFLSAVPSIVAAISIFLVARHSDKTGERKYHCLLASLFGAIGFIVSAYVNQPYLALAALAVAAAGIQSAIPPFWSFPAKMFTGVAAAGAIATINSIGNIGGFVGPYVVGYMSKATGSLQSGLIFLSTVLFIGAIATFFMKIQSDHPKTKNRESAIVPE